MEVVTAVVVGMQGEGGKGVQGVNDREVKSNWPGNWPPAKGFWKGSLCCICIVLKADAVAASEELKAPEEKASIFDMGEKTDCVWFANGERGMKGAELASAKGWPHIEALRELRRLAFGNSALKACCKL